MAQLPTARNCHLKFFGNRIPIILATNNERMLYSYVLFRKDDDDHCVQT